MDRIYETGTDADAAFTMEAVAKRGDIDILIWLHDKYPESRLFLATMETMAASWQVDVVARVLADFPERYLVMLGVLCGGDLALVKKLIASRRPGSNLKKKEIKRAIHNAARHGRLDVLQWFSGVFKDNDCGNSCYVSTKALSSAAHCGHLDVICWIVEQRPELLTCERLAEMPHVSVTQPEAVKSNIAAASRKGDTLQVLHWIDEQLQVVNK